MNIKQRLYEDYLKASRLPNYKRLLEAFYDANYKMVGLYEFDSMLKKGESLEKLLINRHDIDTSPRVARDMFNIEKEVYGKEGNATYYFRKSTIDNQLIADLEAYGYETGYHYEEIATYIKEHKLKNISLIREAMPEIQQIFIDNLACFRADTGSPSLTVASHGDFINSRYKLANHEILKDSHIRQLAGIVAEAYDTHINEGIDARFADHILLDGFFDEVMKEIVQGNRIIMILTHPRNWKVDVKANTRENFIRFYQDAIYRL